MTGYERYSKIRESRGLKDKNVADAIGITRSTFSDWKSGRCSPKLDKLTKIANFLQVSLSDLTGKPMVILEYGDDKKIAQVSLEKPINVEETTLNAKLINKPITLSANKGKSPVKAARIKNSEDIKFIKKFRKLSPKGKEQAIEYIDFLLEKEKK